MKNQIIKTISCVLVFVLTMLALSSCSVVEYIDGIINNDNENYQEVLSNDSDLVLALIE